MRSRLKGSGAYVFVSGITPFTLELTLAKDDFAAQMRQSMKNVGAILEAAGSLLPHPDFLVEVEWVAEVG